MTGMQGWEYGFLHVVGIGAGPAKYVALIHREEGVQEEEVLTPLAAWNFVGRAGWIVNVTPVPTLSTWRDYVVERQPAGTAIHGGTSYTMRRPLLPDGEEKRLT